MPRRLGVKTVSILAALRRGVRYGLDIVQRLELAPGTVYTTLRRLERKDLIRGRWEDPEVAEAERRPRRRYYELTEAGEDALEESLARYEPGELDTAPELDGSVDLFPERRPTGEG